MGMETARMMNSDNAANSRVYGSIRPMAVVTPTFLRTGKTDVRYVSFSIVPHWNVKALPMNPNHWP